ncbi:putative dinucleotide-binding enzyme [Ewingella americana]
MKIGIIGAGFVGRAISKLALKAGHQVMLSNSRDPKTLFTLTRTTQCQAGTPQQAAEFGDIVVIAIPLEAYRSVPAAPLVGKVVIDANNYYPDRDGRIPELDQHQTTTSEMLAKHLPESRIIKAFNAIRMDDLLNDGLPASAQLRTAALCRLPVMTRRARRWLRRCWTSSVLTWWTPVGWRKVGVSKPERQSIACRSIKSS